VCNQISDRIQLIQARPLVPTVKERTVEDIGEIGNILIKQLVAQDDKRPRTQQTTLGVSSLGGCRRQAWHTIRGDVAENNNLLRLASIMGTAIHKAIEDAFPFGEYEKEIRVEVDNLPIGNVDLYIPHLKAVVDWKTTVVRNLVKFPTTQQRWQVQVYGYLLERVGKRVETVTLVAIPRDSDERSIKVHTEPYDESVALEALAWLDDVKQRTEPPAPERPVNFCKHYCKFYGIQCGGIE